MRTCKDNANGQHRNQYSAEIYGSTIRQPAGRIFKGINPDGESLTLNPDFVKRLMDSLNLEFEKAIQQTGNQPVILCSSPIRLIFRRLLERTYPQITIMSYNEVTNNVKAKSVGIIRANMRTATL